MHNMPWSFTLNNVSLATPRAYKWTVTVRLHLMDNQTYLKTEKQDRGRVAPKAACLAAIRHERIARSEQVWYQCDEYGDKNVRTWETRLLLHTKVRGRRTARETHEMLTYKQRVYECRTVRALSGEACTSMETVDMSGVSLKSTHSQTYSWKYGHYYSKTK